VSSFRTPRLRAWEWWRNTVTGEVDTWIITNNQLTGGSAIGGASTAWQPQVIHTT